MPPFQEWAFQALVSSFRRPCKDNWPNSKVHKSFPYFHQLHIYLSHLAHCALRLQKAHFNTDPKAYYTVLCTCKRKASFQASQHSWHQICRFPHTSQFSNSLDTDWVSQFNYDTSHQETVHQELVQQELRHQELGQKLSPTRLLPTSDANWKSLVVTCTSDRLTVYYVFPQPPSWTWSFVRMAHRTQESALLYLLLPVYYKDHSSGSAKWKRWVGQGMWEGAQSFLAFSACVTLPAP